MPIEIAIVGAGEVVNDAHLPAWKRVRGAKVIAICDINADAARNTAHRWNIPRYYSQLAELLRREKAVVVDICTPPATHLPLTIQALEAGCNVTLEKPMAMSLEDSEKIVKAYIERKDKRLKIGVIHSMLFLPHVRDMISKVKAGQIGDIIHVEFKAFSTREESMMSNPDHWCHSLPGGRFGEGLIHPIYLLCTLLGNLEMKSVWVGKRGAHPWAAYDEVFITFEGDKGFASIYNSHNSPNTNVPVMIVYGTKAQLRFEGYDLTLFVRHDSSKGAWNKGIVILREMYQLSRSLSVNIFNKVIPGRKKTPHQIFFTLFLDSLANNKEPPVTLEEAYGANNIFLNVLSELEKLKPWKGNSG